MTAAVELTIIGVSLVLAGWTLVAVVRDRWIGVSHLVGLAVLELVLLVATGIAIAKLVGGARPAELATFVGYLATLVLLPPAATVLAYMERTRWGSVIVAGAAVVCAVLALRLRQVWVG